MPDAEILFGSSVKEIRIRSARFAEVVALAAPLFFTLKVDECVVFQKITQQEHVLLSALDLI